MVAYMVEMGGGAAYMAEYGGAGVVAYMAEWGGERHTRPSRGWQEKGTAYKAE